MCYSSEKDDGDDGNDRGDNDGDGSDVGRDQGGDDDEGDREHGTIVVIIVMKMMPPLARTKPRDGGNLCPALRAEPDAECTLLKYLLNE